MMVESMIEIVLKLIVPAFIAANGLKDGRPTLLGNPFDDEPARQRFREAFQKMAKVEFPNIEKLLLHFKSKDGIVPGKICVGDLTILMIYCASVYFNNDQDLASLAPSTQPVIARLMKNERLRKHVEKAHTIRYC